VKPCRIVDTRKPTGPLAGPPLAAGAARTFVLTGNCGVPTSARAVSLNVTITEATVGGDLRFYAAGTSLPISRTINYDTNQMRANNTIVTLGASGDVTVQCDQASGTVQLILDVNGYFQ
jgi:hypothetical protein